MTALSIERPAADEHAPYFAKYIAVVPDGDVVDLLRTQVADTAALLRTFSPDRERYAYAPDKWTVREVAGHIIDTERVMAYRALRFARNDPSPLTSFDEKLFAANAPFADRALDDIIEELEVVRASTVHLARTLDAHALARRGIASGHTMSVRALLYIIAGHERHHAALLRERYAAR